MERNHQEELDEKFKDIRYLQLKETEDQKVIEDAKKDLLAAQESVRALQEQAQLGSQKVDRLEESLKLQGEELSSLRAKHLKLEENHSWTPSEFAELRRRLVEEFKGIAAASAEVAMRVQQLD